MFPRRKFHVNVLHTILLKNNDDKKSCFFFIYVENYMKSLKRHIVPTIIFSKNNATEVHHTGSTNTCS